MLLLIFFTFVCLLNGYMNLVCFILFADQNTTAFKEVAIIRHPRVGEYAFGFITSSVLLQVLIVILIYQRSYILRASIYIFFKDTSCLVFRCHC